MEKGSEEGTWKGIGYLDGQGAGPAYWLTWSEKFSQGVKPTNADNTRVIFKNWWNRQIKDKKSKDDTIKKLLSEGMPKNLEKKLPGKYKTNAQGKTTSLGQMGGRKKTKRGGLNPPRNFFNKTLKKCKKRKSQRKNKNVSCDKCIVLKDEDGDDQCGVDNAEGSDFITKGNSNCYTNCVPKTKEDYLFDKEVEERKEKKEQLKRDRDDLFAFIDEFEKSDKEKKEQERINKKQELKRDRDDLFAFIDEFEKSDKEKKEPEKVKTFNLIEDRECFTDGKPYIGCLVTGYVKNKDYPNGTNQRMQGIIMQKGREDGAWDGIGYLDGQGIGPAYWLTWSEKFTKGVRPTQSDATRVKFKKWWNSQISDYETLHKTQQKLLSEGMPDKFKYNLPGKYKTNANGFVSSLGKKGGKRRKTKKKSRKKKSRKKRSRKK